MNKLHSLDDLRACRAQCEKALAKETKKILVCGGTGCVAGGTLRAVGDCATILSGAALHLDASVRDSVTVVDDPAYGKVVSEWRDVRANAPLKALPFTERQQTQMLMTALQQLSFPHLQQPTSQILRMLNTM